MTKKRKLTERGQRRAAERAAVGLAKDRMRLAELSAGGAPERPIVVDSAAVVDPRAKDTPCAVCEGRLELEDHAAVLEKGVPLRRLRLRCRQCHAPRELWFSIQPPRRN